MAEAKEEQQLSWIQRVETMESAIELLLETLVDLSDEELERFKKVLQRQVDFHTHYSTIHLKTEDRQDMVFLMVRTNGQKSLEKTKQILKMVNRTDLVQKLSHSGSGPKKKPSVDEQWSAALIHKVATMTAVRELLLETLGTLSHKEIWTFRWLLQFTFFQRSLPRIRKLQWIYSVDIVDLMMEMCGQQSVEVTKEIFMDMNRTDLVQRLPEISSGHKEKLPVDEHWPALIQKMETMVSATELLLETLTGLSDEELMRFREIHQNQTDFHRHVLDSPSYRGGTSMQDTVFLMVQFYGQQSVEKTKEILEEMKRTDLVQKLRDTSSGLKKKHSDELQSALIQKVATMAAVKHLLLETLDELSYMSFKEFLELVTFQKNPGYTIMWKHTADRAEIVDQMVDMYGLQSMELTWEVLKKMNRTDLMRRLSKPSSELKEKHSDEHQSALSERAAVKQIVLETLKDLGHKEIEKIKWLLQFTYYQKSLPHIKWRLQNAYSTNDLVDVMYKTCGQQSVEIIEEVFMDMNRRDLIKSLSEISSRLKEKYQAELLQKKAVEENILETLEDLSYQELEQFKWGLQLTGLKKGLPRIPRQHMETAGRHEMVDLMVKTYGQQSVEVTREVLEEMGRRDLVERLSHSSSGPKKGPSRSLELEAGGSTVQDSSDWTKLEPEVSSTDADEAPTYSLQSEAGNFECSVSSLRWVCKEKVSFKYQFCSWAEHMERMESIKYMPAGSLIDITVISGKLDEVYLSHWICIEDNPEILDKFAVLHIDDCGDEVEKVSEVTSSHVKLSEPVFSPRGVLMKVGFPVKVNCNVLIYKTNTAFLTLHVYLVPDDRGLQQTMDKRELSYGYKVIRKPPPEPLKMGDRFILTADTDVAEIYPKEALMLRYQSRSPNFFEVYIENADEKFELKLSKENKQQPVWTCAIRPDKYQSTGHTQEKHSVDDHESAAVVKWKLLGVLEDLEEERFETFKWHLENSDIGPGLERIPKCQLEGSNRSRVVDLMWDTYVQQSVEVTRKVLEKMKKKNLVKKLRDTS